jgi:hypothetical protein
MEKKNLSRADLVKSMVEAIEEQIQQNTDLLWSVF